MALEFAHGHILWTAASGVGVTFTVSGLSFQPKALRFYWMGLGSSTDAVSETVHSRRGVGFATSTTDRRCVATQDQDAAATSVCTAGYRTDCVALTVTSTPAADGLLDLDALLSDGFRLIVDDAAPVDVSIFWEAWGGSDIVNAATGEIAEPAATGNADYTVTGNFQPDVVMFAGIQATGAAPTAARFDSTLCVGFASSGLAAHNVVVVGGSDDASAAMDTDGYGISGECLAMILVAGGNPNARAQLTQWNANGFRLNWIARATTGRKNIYLAIQGGAWRAGSYTIAGQTVSSTTAVTGLGFAPKGMSFFGRLTTQSTAGTSTANDRMALGSASSTSSRRSMGHLSEDATASSACEIDLTISYDQILSFPSTAGAEVSAYDLSAVGSDGFTVIVDIAGGVSSEWQAFLACGDQNMPQKERRHIRRKRLRLAAA